MRLNDTTRAYFEKLAGSARRSAPRSTRRCSIPQTAARRAELSARTLARRIFHAADLGRADDAESRRGGERHSVGGRGNARHPRAARREHSTQFYAEMAKVIGDPAVKIVPLPQTRPPSPASRLDTEMYRVLERVARTANPGATVLPSMSTGASDQAQLRAKGIQSYGIGPASTESDDMNYPAHGDVERLAESSLYPFVQYVWTAVNEIAAHR